MGNAQLTKRYEAERSVAELSGPLARAQVCSMLRNRGSDYRFLTLSLPGQSPFPLPGRGGGTEKLMCTCWRRDGRSGDDGAPRGVAPAQGTDDGVTSVLWGAQYRSRSRLLKSHNELSTSDSSSPLRAALRKSLRRRVPRPAVPATRSAQPRRSVTRLVPTPPALPQAHHPRHRPFLNSHSHNINSNRSSHRLRDPELCAPSSPPLPILSPVTTYLGRSRRTRGS